MQYEMFSVPADDGQEETEELNRFLRANRIVSVEKVFRDSTTPRWYFSVEYLEGTPGDGQGHRRRRRVDYKEILNPEDFTVFSRLRDLRKELAQADAVPVYAVCTNEQLAAMVTNRCTTKEALQAVDGFGEMKLKKYGERFLYVLSEAFAS